MGQEGINGLSAQGCITFRDGYPCPCTSLQQPAIVHETPRLAKHSNSLGGPKILPAQKPTRSFERGEAS